MRITCNNTGKNVSITRNNEYEVVSETDNRYTIINDKGIEKNYAKNLFTVIPEVPPVEIINELNIETAITINNNRLGFTIHCPFIGRNRFNYNSGEIITQYGSNISCGIYELLGLDNLLTNLRNLRTAFDTYLQNNSEVFVLNEDIDLDDTFKDIYTALIQDLIQTFQGAGPRCGLLLLSTTTNSIDSNQDFKDVLNELSTSVTTVVNPNSTREINLWVLNCNEGAVVPVPAQAELQENDQEQVIEAEEEIAVREW